MPVDEVCGGCRFKKTKPPPCPPELLEVVEFLERQGRRQHQGLVSDEALYAEWQLEALDGKSDAKSLYDQLRALQQRRENPNSGAPPPAQPGLPGDLRARMRRLS